MVKLSGRSSLIFGLIYRNVVVMDKECSFFSCSIFQNDLLSKFGWFELLQPVICHFDGNVPTESWLKSSSNMVISLGIKL